MREANPKTIYLKDYTPPDYLITDTCLTLELDAPLTRVTAELTLQRHPASHASDRALILQGETLTLLNITLDGVALSPKRYRVDDETLTLFAVPQDRPFTLQIVNTVCPEANTALEGLYVSNGMLCTQCEAQGFRKITYYLDRPDVMSRFTTTLIADRVRYPVLLSNGNPIASGENAEGRHWITWQDPFNKPCYLFALVAGQLACVRDSYRTSSGRDIDLRIYVEAHDLDKCAHAMQSLKHAMRWDEEHYGREYDLDLYMIVAVSHFNMGAMENKGLNIFNTKYVLARPDTATDSDYEHIEGVIAHEYFHNWTGNRITCRDWFQLSLKEGLTVFRDQEFTSDRTSRAVKRIEDVNLLRTRQFAEDSGPLAHPVRPESYIEINNFYTLTVYEKGAEVVRMLQTLLGTAGFRRGMDLYFARHDGQAVTCDDFVKAMEDANAVDLTQFKRWYSQAGTPEIHVSYHYDASQRCLQLHLQQHCPPTPGQPHKLPLHIPVRLGLLAEDGQPLTFRPAGNSQAVAECVLELRETQQTFVLQDVPSPPVVSLLRGFSAPVKLTLPRSHDELAFLMRYDSDAFNRWDAGQQLAMALMLAAIDDWRGGRELAVDPRLINGMAELLKQDRSDLSFVALLLQLPSESYVAENMAVIDVEAIHGVREFFKRTLAKALHGAFAETYRRHHAAEDGALDAKAIGRRRVKNICLHYLLTLDEAEIYRWASAQFDHAPTMTDQLAALEGIVNSQHPDKTDYLQAFYRQWQDEALVIDKWFALQASSPVYGHLQTIYALLQHPAFDLRTPNRVRALVGAFSQANPIHFHDSRGRGYVFLADQVLALNALNPQVAARMLSALTHWRRYDVDRQQSMKRQLERVMHTPAISRDVYEVANKSLA